MNNDLMNINGGEKNPTALKTQANGTSMEGGSRRYYRSQL
jgi:hypothetical protein